MVVQCKINILLQFSVVLLQQHSKQFRHCAINTFLGGLSYIEEDLFMSEVLIILKHHV